ncbi:triose-phosphate transporter family-domain-containing protein [Glomus cerebriforme]|uniref:Triose-phosphate transporter family-domain-containing protein n=1 Tax=Glomus cerebriforme TaxID=658196 RepID=A0A397TJ49_9GLOM|nr:triose-phosphate transporter family-domain-containing protein [Glomus cerebriforme]
MVIFSVSFYIVTALIMVFVNKWVLNNVSLPFTLLWFQVIVAVILLHFSSIFNILQLPTIEKEKCAGLLPLIVINVLGLSFNTVCLQYVDASFYQVARALVLPFTVMFSFVFLNQKSSYKILLACLVVCIGFFVGVSSERLTISVVGIIFGICSSISTALHAIVIKKSLDVVKGNTMDLVYYNNFMSAIAFLPLIFLFGEHNQLSELFIQDTTSKQYSMQAKTFLVGILVTGLFGFLINIAGFLQIKVTSPVTHMISSAFRGVVQTILGYLLFDDLLTTGRVGGIFLILLGSCFYTWIKDQESKQVQKIDKKIYDKLERGDSLDEGDRIDVIEDNEK